MGQEPDPVVKAIRVLEKKWTLLILRELGRSRRRFCELQEAIGNPNSATLTERLKELEEEGIVARRVVRATPPWVEYSLTPKGEALRQMLHCLEQWALRWVDGENPAPSTGTEAEAGTSAETAWEEPVRSGHAFRTRPGPARPAG